jgi:hypothetical protein
MLTAAWREFFTLLQRVGEMAAWYELRRPRQLRARGVGRLLRSVCCHQSGLPFQSRLYSPGPLAVPRAAQINRAQDFECERILLVVEQRALIQCHAQADVVHAMC